jgi:uncharacterized hydrophobic protein (TIGR00271 family)
MDNQQPAEKNLFAVIQRWVHALIRPLPLAARKDIVAEVAPAASPGFDFFLLVVLSCSIATMGLITDSPAVIIGAMLVAPLMSPIIGIGLASLTGNTRLLRSALSALLRGAALAVALSALMTLINNLLPFFSIQELPAEVLSRTRPSPIDLVIALAGGIAAAYALTQPNLSAALPGVAIATALMPPLCTVGIGVALGRWDVAGGALLLFVTNAVTIAFASVLVFFLRGFSTELTPNGEKVPRSLVLAAGLTILLLVPLFYFSIKFFQEASDNRLINTVVAEEVAKITGAELTDLEVNRSAEGLQMVVTVRTGSSLQYQQVVDLQKAIVAGINQPVTLKVSQVIAESLDPLIPPTPTATPTNTVTASPGPSPTATHTPTASPTLPPTQTPTASVTPTQLPSPTPAGGAIQRLNLPAIKLYQQPGGPVIGSLYGGQKITVLYATQVYAGLVWLQIEDSDGRIGWIPQIYVLENTPAPTPTLTPSLTRTPALSVTP